MIENDIFFPVRYEKSRPFINKLNALYHKKTFREVNDIAFLTKVQDIIYDEISEIKLPTGLSIDQQKFELQLAKELNFFYFYHLWKCNGRNIFHFSKELLTLFENTDVDEIPLNSIEFPFTSFYLSFADLDKQYGIDILNNELFVDGVLITKDVAKQNRIDFFMATRVKNAINTREWFYKDSYASVNVGWYRINYDQENNTLKKAGFVAKAVGKDQSFENKEQAYAIFWNYINLALNAICYLSTKPVSEKLWTTDMPTYLIEKLTKAKTKHQKDIINREILSRGFSKVSFLGHELKSHVGTVLTGNILPTHWRRGHWRNQVFGEGLSQTKLIWIRPTIVNKDNNEILKGRIYET